MSGGHFDYQQYHIEDIANSIEKEIEEATKPKPPLVWREGVSVFKKIDDWHSVGIYEGFKTYDEVISKIEIESGGFEPVSPLDVSPDEATYPEHMGKDIAALLNCDAAVFLDGWKNSKGCVLEHCACKIYKKHIFYGLNDFVTNKYKL